MYGIFGAVFSTLSGLNEMFEQEDQEDTISDIITPQPPLKPTPSKEQTFLKFLLKASVSNLPLVSKQFFEKDSPNDGHWVAKVYPIKDSISFGITKEDAEKAAKESAISILASIKVKTEQLPNKAWKASAYKDGIQLHCAIDESIDGACEKVRFTYLTTQNGIDHTISIKT